MDEIIHKSLDDILDAYSGSWIDCTACQGIGWIQQDLGGGNHSDPEPCQDCDATGQIHQKDMS